MTPGTQPVSARRRLLERVADAVPAPGPGRPVPVGVDGVDGAGKSTFAAELAQVLAERGHPVVHASVDGFHHPREVRYRRGRSSPEGYWLDSYDYDRLVSDLLAPFAPGADRRYRGEIHDVRRERPVDAPQQEAADGTVLVVDGIFLHRDELVDHWDFSIFLDVDIAVSVARMAVRDAAPPYPQDPANVRYVQGQRLYLAACDPASRADLVIDNNDPARPVVTSPDARSTRDA